MKIHQQTKKLAFSPTRPGGVVIRGLKRGVSVGEKMSPADNGLLDPYTTHSYDLLNQMIQLKYSNWLDRDFMLNSTKLPHFYHFHPFRGVEIIFSEFFFKQMFLSSKYEQNEVSYIKIHQQTKKLAFSPPQPGGVMIGGVKNGVPVGGKMSPTWYG